MYRSIPEPATADRAIHLSGAVALSAALSVGLVLTTRDVALGLGVPAGWPWLLTGLQVTALWAAGTKRRWGWLLGAAVQPPWIVYAILTDQFGFIAGCAVSAAVQAYSYLRHTSAPPTRDQPSHAGFRLEGRGKASTRSSARPTVRVRGDRHEPELLPCPC
jgi:hypothetical protein